MQRTSVTLILTLVLAIGTARAAGPSADRHVVVVVWDGMRPDFVSEATTPHLWSLAQSGVFFANHHSVFPSATVVNGTALATGAYPAHSFVVANTDYRPRIDPEHSVGIESLAAVRRGDELSGGHYLGISTVAESLHAHSLATAIAGSKGVALLHDRAPRASQPAVSPVVYASEALPPELDSVLLQTLGAFPPAGKPDDKRARDAWTTQALIGLLWKDGVPPYSLLWLAEPDSTEHATGPGSPASLAAIRSSDDNLGLLLAELDRRGLRTTTDVLVVSDHGFSTYRGAVDVAAALAAAGFDARSSLAGGLAAGQIMVSANGGCTLLYVGGRGADLVQRLVTWLEQQDWVGTIFARSGLEGTFPLSAAHIDSPDAPDLVVSWHWSHDQSPTGVPGLLGSGTGSTPDRPGGHASLSVYDMHNTLIAAGPDFRAGVRDPLPSGNTDLAPTILWILGLKDEAARRDGRVLGEALVDGVPPLRSFEVRHLTARRDLGGGRTWEQYLNVSELNGVQYLDEGNGRQVPAH